MGKETDPAQVARRIMGIEWQTNPFLKEVNLDVVRPLCPFREDVYCRAVRKRGKRKDWVYPRCPDIVPHHRKPTGPPPECPLRFGEIVIKRKE